MKNEIKQRIEGINLDEVPNGYIKTNFGIIPVDWNVKKCGEVGMFKKGKGISTTNTIEIGLPALMYGDIYMKYNTCFSSVDYKVSEQTAKNSTPASKGDLLFTCSGETAEDIGKCVIYQGSETIYIGGDIVIVTPKTCYDNLFLAYQQNSFPIIKQKARLGQGYSVVHIYTDLIKLLRLPIPPLPEQKKIAEILSTWDKAIEFKEKRIKTLMSKKTGMLQKLIAGTVRLPGFNPNWEQFKLKTLLIEVNDRNRKLKTTTVYSISNKNGFIPQNEQFEKIVASKDISNYKIISKGCIAYNPSRINVGSIASFKEDYNVVVSPMYVVFKCKDKLLLTLFLEQWLDSHTFDQQMKALLSGSVRNSLNFSDLSLIKINLPSIKEQTAIVKVLSLADLEISLQKAELETLKLQKKGLMQVLLTGKVRTV